MILKHHAESAPITRHRSLSNFGGALSADANIATGRSIQEKQQSQQSAFPRPRMTCQKGHLSLFKRQIEMAQRINLTKTTTDAIKFDQLERASTLIDQGIDEVTGSEIAEVLRLLPNTNKTDGSLQLMRNRKQHAPTRGAI